jgi:hypothetical protein
MFVSAIYRIVSNEICNTLHRLEIINGTARTAVGSALGLSIEWPEESECLPASSMPRG